MSENFGVYLAFSSSVSPQTLDEKEPGRTGEPRLFADQAGPQDQPILLPIEPKPKSKNLTLTAYDFSQAFFAVLYPLAPIPQQNP